MGGIFISYRRDHDGHAAGRLHGSLRQWFASDQLFFDVANIEPGLNFATAIQAVIASSDVMLVVIGPEWLNSQDLNGRRRLDDPEDFVRLEIEAALQRGLRAIPVLIDGTEMPKASDLPTSLKALASLNATTMSHASFQRDAGHLNRVLSKAVAPRGPIANEWNAELIKRDRGYFLIEFSRFSEHHRLEFTTSLFGITGKLELDGNVVVARTLDHGRKKRDFQVGAHPNQFQLRFDLGPNVSTIELWVDNRLILASS